jgi:hypothetical protein
MLVLGDGSIGLLVFCSQETIKNKIKVKIAAEYFIGICYWLLL